MKARAYSTIDRLSHRLAFATAAVHEILVVIEARLYGRAHGDGVMIDVASPEAF